MFWSSSEEPSAVQGHGRSGICSIAFPDTPLFKRYRLLLRLHSYLSSPRHSGLDTRRGLLAYYIVPDRCACAATSVAVRIPFHTRAVLSPQCLNTSSNSRRTLYPYAPAASMFLTCKQVPRLRGRAPQEQQGRRCWRLERGGLDRALVEGCRHGQVRKFGEHTLCCVRHWRPTDRGGTGHSAHRLRQAPLGRVPRRND